MDKKDGCVCVGDTVQLSGMGQPMKVDKIVGDTACCSFKVGKDTFSRDFLTHMLVVCKEHRAYAPPR